MPRHKEGLSPKQREFLRQYLLTRNASEAYRKSHNYKGKNADVLASQLLVKPSIQVEIKKHEARRQEEFELSEKAIIQELAAIAFGHAGKVMEWNEEHISLIPKDEMSENDQKFIESLGETAGEFGNSLSIKTMAGQKVRALELLGKHIGMWKDGRSGTDPGDRGAVLKRLSEHFRKRRERGGEG